MKISFVLPALYGTGGINVVYEYARRLSMRGDEVIVYVPVRAYNMHRGSALVDWLKQLYATIKVILSVINKQYKKVEIEKKVKIKMIWRVCNKLVQNSDMIIATAWCTAFDVSKLSESKGSKVYFVQDYEVWDNAELGKNSYKLPLKKVVIAEWIKKRLISECGCNGEDIAIVNNGLDTKLFHAVPGYKQNERKISCLMLDHTLEKKGVKYGIEAFNKAKKDVPQLELKMFGVKKSKYVNDTVEYYENPDQEILIKLYQEADIFIFPSLEEGWGLTPIEAMACMCAVVGTNVGCMLDIGRDGENVILCEKANSDSLAEAIVKLSMDNELRKSISEKGFSTIQKLDWEASTDKFRRELMALNR